MAIDLLNRFATGQVNKTVNAANTQSVVAADSAEAAKLIRSVYAMKAGDTLQGQLVSANGTDISLLLGESVTLSAKLDKELSLTPGQLMSFTINSNKNGKLSLSPLFANTGMEQNAMKALDAAGIPVTDKSLAMTQELMKQGLPINKQTLQTVFRQISMYPEAGVGDIVMLHKMDIPVTADHVSMMQLYRTNQQHLFSDLQGLSGQIADTLLNMAANGQSNLTNTFIKGFIDIFSPAESNGGAMLTADGQVSQNMVTDTAAGNIPGNVNDGIVGTQSETVPVDKNIQSVTEQALADDKITISENRAGETVFAKLFDPMKAEAELTELLKQAVSKNGEGKDALSQTLFSLLKEQILMNPEDVRSAEYVKEFYEKLDGQISRLQELLNSTGQEESALAKQTSTVKSNIQFMNQINELYHYVQLPLKMNNAQAKGDLYVYKRKQAKTGDDGRLTALLHLSMPTLGNMDVFLALEEQKLSTRFCMEKEEMIDFIESHIDQLNERLMKKGYNVQTSVTAGTKEEKNVIGNIMERELPIPVMTSQSFDARC